MDRFHVVRSCGALAGLVLAAAGGGAGAQSPAAGDRSFEATTLSLSAYGEREAAPDKATITLGVQVRADSAAAAMRADAARMSQVIAALRQGGIADKDIQTSDLSLAPQYAYPQGGGQKLTGYQASNQVAIAVEDLSRLGPAVDAAVAAGADQVNGISFGLKDPRAAEDAARKAAVAALRDKAELYAAATGYRVLRLVNLSEGGGYEPGPVRPFVVVSAARRAPTPVEAGQLTVRIDITGIYELGKASAP